MAYLCNNSKNISTPEVPAGNNRQERYAVQLDWKSLTQEETENMDAAAWLPELQALWQAFALEKR